MRVDGSQPWLADPALSGKGTPTRGGCSGCPAAAAAAVAAAVAATVILTPDSSRLPAAPFLERSARFAWRWLLLPSIMLDVQQLV
eukprot:COSAG06_NODE_35401_length_460_cov_1.274238_1_plen_84_part_01